MKKVGKHALVLSEKQTAAQRVLFTQSYLEKMQDVGSKSFRLCLWLCRRVMLMPGARSVYLRRCNSRGITIFERSTGKIPFILKICTLKCVCVCMNLYAYVCLGVYMGTGVHVCLCLYTYILKWLCTCVHASIYVFMYKHEHKWICVCLCVFGCVYMCEHMCA